MGTNIAMFDAASEEEKAAAAKFVKWLTNAENTVYFAIKTGYLPVTYSGLSSQEYQDFLEANPTQPSLTWRPLNTATGSPRLPLGKSAGASSTRW